MNICNQRRSDYETYLFLSKPTSTSNPMSKCTKEGHATVNLIIPNTQAIVGCVHCTTPIIMFQITYSHIVSLSLNYLVWNNKVYGF